MTLSRPYSIVTWSPSIFPSVFVHPVQCHHKKDRLPDSLGADGLSSSGAWSLIVLILPY